MPYSLNLRESLYCGSQLLIGSKMLLRLREFRELWLAPCNTVEAVRRQKLSRLLDHAAAHVPYYKRLMKPGQRLRLEDFPILTKDAIRQHFRELMTADLKKEHEAGGRRGYSWLEVKTGGTTGRPNTVIHDARFRDYGRAARLFAQQICGFSFGTPYVRLWGSMAEIQRLKQSRLNRLTRWLAREKIVNGFQITAEGMERCLDQMEKHRIRHLMAYVDCAIELARFARQRGRPAPKLDSIMACAGTVTENARAVIEGVFECKLHNLYGSRDCPAMACECKHGKIHVFANHVWIEVVDKNARPVSVGQTGRILVTLLENYSFPLIRYEIGDIGAPGTAGCACGSSFPVLEKIEGRTVEQLETSRGDFVSPLFVIHLLGVVHNPGWIRRFRFVQCSYKEFNLWLELSETVDRGRLAQMAEALRRDLEVVFGSGCQLNVRPVEAIAPAPSGKYVCVVNEMRT